MSVNQVLHIVLHIAKSIKDTAKQSKTQLASLS